jgi:hypothetical protein
VRLRASAALPPVMAQQGAPTPPGGARPAAAAGRASIELARQTEGGMRSHDIRPSDNQHDFRAQEHPHDTEQLRKMKHEIEAMHEEIQKLEAELSQAGPDRRTLLKPMLASYRNTVRRHERMFALQLQKAEWERELAEVMMGGTGRRHVPTPPKRDARGRLLLAAKGPRVANHTEVMRKSIDSKKEKIRGLKKLTGSLGEEALRQCVHGEATVAAAKEKLHALQSRKRWRYSPKRRAAHGKVQHPLAFGTGSARGSIEQTKEVRDLQRLHGRFAQRDGQGHLSITVPQHVADLADFKNLAEHKKNIKSPAPGSISPRGFGMQAPTFRGYYASGVPWGQLETDRPSAVPLQHAVAMGGGAGGGGGGGAQLLYEEEQEMAGPPEGHRFKGHQGGEHAKPPPRPSVLGRHQGQMAALGLHWTQYLRLLQDSGFVPGARPQALLERAPVGTLYKEDGAALLSSVAAERGQGQGPGGAAPAGKGGSAAAAARLDVWRLQSALDYPPADYVDEQAGVGVRERVGCVHRPEDRGLPALWYVQYTVLRRQGGAKAAAPGAMPSMMLEAEETVLYHLAAQSHQALSDGKKAESKMGAAERRKLMKCSTEELWIQALRTGIDPHRLERLAGKVRFSLSRARSLSRPRGLSVFCALSLGCAVLTLSAHPTTVTGGGRPSSEETARAADHR